MSRPHVIVAIGEALLREFSDCEEPAGLALLVPLHAKRLGHTGIAISRLGQDATAERLLTLLQSQQIDASHLQSDPDLPTGRLRLIGSSTSRGDEARAAFDELQWDFDLADVAQQADAVVYGALARRTGQCRSVIDRFLAECGSCLRVLDLTNRADHDEPRTAPTSGLKFADVVVVDEAALAVVLPSAIGKPTPDAMSELLRQSDAQVALWTQPDQPLALYTASASWTGSQPIGAEAREATVVGLVHGMLNGWDMREALRLAERVTRHAIEHRGQPPPAELLARS
ncbi:MAG: hypothetical protein IIC46_04615 [Planctomycetes bacterium]|nr:hypothetical protein [Planctomycetota bacterium]